VFQKQVITLGDVNDFPIYITAIFSRKLLRATAHSAKRVIATAKPSVCLSVCPSRAGIVPRRMKIESCGLHCEVANTNNGWGRRSLPPKIGGHSDPPPLKSADFDQYMLIASQYLKS